MSRASSRSLISDVVGSLFSLRSRQAGLTLLAALLCSACPTRVEIGEGRLRTALEKTRPGTSTPETATEIPAYWGTHRALVGYEWLVKDERGTVYVVTFDWTADGRNAILESWRNLRTGSYDKQCAFSNQGNNIIGGTIHRACIGSYEEGRAETDGRTWLGAYGGQQGSLLRTGDECFVTFTGKKTEARDVRDTVVTPERFTFFKQLKRGQSEQLANGTLSVDELMPSIDDQIAQIVQIVQNDELLEAKYAAERRKNDAEAAKFLAALNASLEQAKQATSDPETAARLTEAQRTFAAVEKGEELPASPRYAALAKYLRELKSAQETRARSTAAAATAASTGEHAPTADSTTSGPAPSSENSANFLEFGEWLYLQSDMLVQSRMALVRKDGAVHEMAIEFRVLRQNEHGQASCLSSCNGFVLSFSHFQKTEVIHFEPSFTEPKVHRLPWNLRVDAVAAEARWDDKLKRLVSLSTGELLRVYSAKVDTVAIGQTSKFRYDIDWAKRVVLK
jgi:hypothetical protein